MTPRQQAGLGLGLLVTLQLGAWGIYRAVESKREEQISMVGFDYEMMARPSPTSDILMEQADGRTVHLRDYAGDAVLLHFWATWCVPCRTELPDLIALANRLERASPARVLLVSVDEDWASIRHFFSGDVPAQVLRDATARAKQAYGVTTLPDTYVLQPGLVATARIHGAREWGSAIAGDSLRKLLGLKEVE
jgi:thiol-disulfide isomerase/thioredoxin